ncbi:hypothetical protein HDU91_004007, partial [Kappamyces sp. JEL0680]
MTNEKHATAVPTTGTPSGTDDWSVPADVRANPLFVEIAQGGNVISALKELDSKMRQSGLSGLISNKPSNPLLGKLVEAGRFAVWDTAGKPEISISPGRYLNFNPACSWQKSYDLTEHVEVLGLTIAQVGQSEAMVIQDPQNRVFVVRNGGFVSYGAFGRFKVLAVVDTLNLGQNNAVLEAGTNRTLGYKHEVKSQLGSTQMTVATFFNVPANNVVVLQQGTQIFALHG